MRIIEEHNGGKLTLPFVSRWTSECKTWVLLVELNTGGECIGMIRTRDQANLWVYIWVSVRRSACTSVGVICLGIGVLVSGGVGVGMLMRDELVCGRCVGEVVITCLSNLNLKSVYQALVNKGFPVVHELCWITLRGEVKFPLRFW